MLYRENKLTKNSEFELVKRKGVAFDSTSFSLLVMNRNDNETTRFGFVISNKISNSAVIRNKSKRALHEGVRHNITNIKKGFDCVFLAKPIIIKRYTDELLREVREILGKANLLLK